MFVSTNVMIRQIELYGIIYGMISMQGKLSVRYYHIIWCVFLSQHAKGNIKYNFIVQKCSTLG